MPVFKKGDRQIVTNYRPISLSSNLSKVFERLVFKVLYEYLQNNNLLSPKNSGSRKKDSCVCQLIHIVHKIYDAVEIDKEVRGILLDIFKTFDEVCHEGLIHKLKRIGIAGPLPSWIESYLTGCLQQVIIRGQESQWIPLSAGFPQGSILGPPLFLIFINDLPEDVNCDINLFADDTSLFDVIEDPKTTAANLNKDLQAIQDWAFKWRVTFNADEVRSQNPPLIFQGLTLTLSPYHKHPVIDPSERKDGACSFQALVIIAGIMRTR